VFSAEDREIAGDERFCLECHREFTGLFTNCPHDQSILVKRVHDHLIGARIATYEIESMIGQGAMGIVYKARHLLMEKTVAIKMLKQSLVSDSHSVKRFQHESKAASKLDHPHVIKVFDFGLSDDGRPYIVMDFLEGVSLADLIKAKGQVTIERTIRVIGQACSALDHAHRQGVIHRDLKPTNIVLTKYDQEDDFVKVVDFGVAKLLNAGAEGQKLTQDGEVCGSPVYMSPEQCIGNDLDPRSDIYSMGIVIYESLTGKLPILGKTLVDTMSRHLTEPPVPLKEARPDLYIPERLEAVIFKALAKNPADRHQTMQELKMDLEGAIPQPGRSQVLRTQALSEKDRTKKSKAPMPMLIGAGAALVTAIAGAIVFFVMHGSSKAPTAPPAVTTQVQAPAPKTVPPPTEPATASAPSTVAPTAQHHLPGTPAAQETAPAMPPHTVPNVSAVATPADSSQPAKPSVQPAKKTIVQAVKPPPKIRVAVHKQRPSPAAISSAPKSASSTEQRYASLKEMYSSEHSQSAH
jgi:serine/threonine protein kinase